MKKLNSTLKIAALVVLISFNCSLYAQQVKSFISTNKSNTAITEMLTTKTTSIHFNNETKNNWFSGKNYLEFSSPVANYHILMMLNEKVYEPVQGIEPWMGETENFKIEKKYSVQNESVSEIESWMTDTDFWQIKPETDKKSLEAWMMDSSRWVLVR